MWRSMNILFCIALWSVTVLADAEWGGIFELDSTVPYTWSAQKVDGAYAEETMKLFLYPVAGANDTELHAAYEAYEAQVNVTGFVLVTTATGNSTLLLETPMQLQFDTQAWMSLFTLQVPQSGFYAIVAEHDPEEFVSTDHYLKDADGNDIEPLYVHNDHDEGDGHSDDDEEHTRWGETMGACVAVWVVTLIGIVFITLSVAGIPMSPKIDFFGKLFAAGGLLGTAFCLIFLEASHYIETKGSLSEGEMHGHWAAMVLTGFITPILIDFFSKALLTAALTAAPSSERSKATVVAKETAIVAVVGATVQGSYELVEAAADQGSGGTEKLQEPQSTASLQEQALHEQQAAAAKREHAVELQHRRHRILSAVLIGDFFHNFCDGIFIGVAFQSCATSFGWTVTSITVFHEIIQELSDFLVLTKAAQLPAWQALVWNAFSGLSVILGGIVIASSHVDDYTVGMLLAFGAGQYLYIGAVELMPMIHDSQHTAADALHSHNHHHHHHHVSVADEEAAGDADAAATTAANDASTAAAAMKVTPFDRAVGLVCFMVAVVVAGLILLNHEHCEVSSHSDSSSGGGHHH